MSHVAGTIVHYTALRLRHGSAHEGFKVDGGRRPRLKGQRFTSMARKQSIHPCSGRAGLETEQALADQQVLIKGARSLLSMNQPQGFKCSSCAWPDPSRHFPVKICENGAKALAWETTAKRVTREFLAAHTVSWLEAQLQTNHSNTSTAVADTSGVLRKQVIAAATAIVLGIAAMRRCGANTIESCSTDSARPTPQPAGRSSARHGLGVPAAPARHGGH